MKTGCVDCSWQLAQYNQRTWKRANGPIVKAAALQYAALTRTVNKSIEKVCVIWRTSEAVGSTQLTEAWFGVWYGCIARWWIQRLGRDGDVSGARFDIVIAGHALMTTTCNIDTTPACWESSLSLITVANTLNHDGPWTPHDAVRTRHRTARSTALTHRRLETLYFPH